MSDLSTPASPYGSEDEQVAALTRRMRPLALGQAISAGAGEAARPAEELSTIPDEALPETSAAPPMPTGTAMLLTNAISGGPLTDDDARRVLDEPQLRRTLSLLWRVDCPPPDLLTATAANPRSPLAELVATCHPDCATCKGQLQRLEAENHALSAELTDERLTAAVAEWRVAFGVAEMTEARSGNDMARGEKTVDGLAGAGVHPRLTWQADPGAGILTVLLQPDPPLDEQSGPPPTLEATLDNKTWHPFTADEYGDLRADLPLLPREDHDPTGQLRIRRTS